MPRARGAPTPERWGQDPMRGLLGLSAMSWHAVQVNGAALKKGGAMGKSEYDVPAGVTVLGAYKPEFEAILTPEALEFVATLARKFSPRCGTIAGVCMRSAVCVPRLLGWAGFFSWPHGTGRPGRGTSR